jgi:lipopolysaccharide export LptBFGC system permease protein LptF
MEAKNKWYFKTSIFVIAVLCIGPLALPLAWFNPRYRPAAKVIITIVVIVLTYYLCIALAASMSSISKYYEELYKAVYQ